MYKVIQGRDSLYIVHRAKKVPVFPPDEPPDVSETVVEWSRYMKQIRLCDTRVEGSCPPEFLH